MPSTIDARIELLLADYLKHWGPVSWRHELAAAKPPRNPALGDILLSLSAIETDSRVIYRKLQAAGLDRRPAIREFAIPWAAEEAEHGRATYALARTLGSTAIPPRRRDHRHVRSMTAWPALLASRGVRAVIEPVYLIIGVITEYTALIIYREVAQQIGDANAARILHRIASQEGRHLRFYRSAANAVLESTPYTAAISAIVRYLWRPAGVDLMGETAWLSIFGGMLADEGYRARVLRTDDLVSSLPGMAHLSPRRQFLSRHGYSIPRSLEKRAATEALDEFPAMVTAVNRPRAVLAPAREEPAR